MIANTLILKSGESKRNASWKDSDQGRIGRPSVCPFKTARCLPEPKDLGMAE